ncbi:hypothetical protein SCP_0205820 [Sparassis crispa]|uniref:Uncharacterized protein n=1 Tax=Sparassis crispa TaxID=139825 RepID=A0A401GB42_9APHY|nr:hypothetical protein SCP_0205820 [Sparassis crispa]GBE79384.1 hypothetical protein SCP_0205820 [Sparassis crispa]
MNDIPFNFVKNQLATGTALHGLSANFTEDLSPTKEEILKQAASSFYSVPGDCILNPHILPDYDVL